VLQANSPVEVALKLVKTKEQRRELLERIQQEDNETPVR